MDDITVGPKEEQVRKAQRLQDLLLDNFTELAETGELTAADRKTLVQFLQQNGWTVDPAAVPKKLRDKLTEIVDPADVETEHPHLKAV